MGWSWWEKPWHVIVLELELPAVYWPVVAAPLMNPQCRRSSALLVLVSQLSAMLKQVLALPLSLTQASADLLLLQQHVEVHTFP